jgi:hypothetical protein
MTQPRERDPIYRGRRFQTETIELCVRWYITCRLSYLLNRLQGEDMKAKKVARSAHGPRHVTPAGRSCQRRLKSDPFSWGTPK